MASSNFMTFNSRVFSKPPPSPATTMASSVFLFGDFMASIWWLFQLVVKLVRSNLENCHQIRFRDCLHCHLQSLSFRTQIHFQIHFQHSFLHPPSQQLLLSPLFRNGCFSNNLWRCCLEKHAIQPHHVTTFTDAICRKTCNSTTPRHGCHGCSLLWDSAWGGSLLHGLGHIPQTGTEGPCH